MIGLRSWPFFLKKGGGGVGVELEPRSVTDLQTLIYSVQGLFCGIFGYVVPWLVPFLV